MSERFSVGCLGRRMRQYDVRCPVMVSIRCVWGCTDNVYILLRLEALSFCLFCVRIRDPQCFEMGNGMSETLKGVYVGNFRDSKDDVQLNNNNITHIISIHDNAKPLRADKKYLCFQADDAAGQNLIQFFAESNNFIHECRLGGGNVLIHCLAGVSRSVTLTVAYMMTVTDYKWEDCLRAVKSTRTVAHPNFGFQRQLQEYEHSQLQERKQDLFLRYPKYSPEEDTRKMVELLERYQKENRDPHESFIYPLPRNAYNRRLEQEREAREAESASKTNSDSKPVPSKDPPIHFADQQD